jgi:hypothetical protein
LTPDTERLIAEIIAITHELIRCNEALDLENARLKSRCAELETRSRGEWPMPPVERLSPRVEVTTIHDPWGRLADRSVDRWPNTYTIG